MIKFLSLERITFRPIYSATGKAISTRPAARAFSLLGSGSSSRAMWSSGWSSPDSAHHRGQWHQGSWPACVWSPGRRFKGFSCLRGQAGNAWEKDLAALGQTGGFPLLRFAQSGETHLAHRPSQRLVDPPESGKSSGSACARGHLAAPDGLPGVIPYPHGFRRLYRPPGGN